MASRVSVGRPEERGADLGWLDVTYDFDPDRYQREMPVRVEGVSGPAYLVGPFGGPPRRLACTVSGTGAEVVVPFDDGPAALLVFPGGDAAEEVPLLVPGPEREIVLGSSWDMELVPTLDNSWGDFARPAGDSVPLERWDLLHRVEGDEAWTPVHATFGPHGIWRTGTAADAPWRTAEYSDSRGIRKDPIHRDVLGPKGHVPEEFLDFGDVRAGEQVAFRARLTVPDGPGGHPAIGAAAAKTLLVDGTAVALDDRGYLAIGTAPLPAGDHDIELRLVPDEDVRLRAHVAVVSDPGRYRRPEWMTVAGDGRPDTSVAFTTALRPGETVVQVVSAEPCRILLDGREIGRQGGFDPYAEQEIPRAGRYEVPDGTELTLIATGASPAVLVDGPAVSGPGWTATRDGEPVPVLARRRQHGDPAALHLRRRPHPLPGANWLEDGEDDSVVATRLAVPDAQTRIEWLRFTVPPGATRMSFEVIGELLDVRLDDQRLEFTAGSAAFDSLLPGSDRPAARTASLRIRTRPGHQAGAALAGPVRFAAGPGTIGPGDWEDVGLAGYSGGVRYRQKVEIPEFPGTATLDLGRVRGTAEVTVNGRAAGIRVCAPYTFDLGTALRPGANEIEAVVYGTLAPYLDDVSPTHFVFDGQRVSGLFGPVRVRLPEIS
jgi:hypothetical protein